MDKCFRPNSRKPVSPIAAFRLDDGRALKLQVDQRKLQVPSRLLACVVPAGRGGETKLVSAPSPIPTLMNVQPLRPPPSQPSLKYGITYSSRKWALRIFLIGAFNARIGCLLSRLETKRLDNSSPAPVALVSAHHDGSFSMVHRRRQIGRACTIRRARGPLRPRNANESLPTQKVDLMKTVYPDEDSDRKSITLSIVPEVDEEVEEEPGNALPTVFLKPEEPPKNLKRKRSLVELVLDVAFLMRRKVKGKVLTAQSQDRPLQS